MSKELDFTKNKAGVWEMGTGLTTTMKAVSAVTAAVGTMAVSIPAFAAGTGPDFTTLSSAVDFSTAVTAVMAVAAAVVTVLIAVRGAKFVLAMVRS
jgi:hypothetical protein